MSSTAVNMDVPPPRSARRRSIARPQAELSISIARTREEVAAAWNLVYRSYLQANLINGNPFEIHTVPHALNAKTSVVVGRINDEIVSTLTIMHDDRKRGLPLDKVYRTQLDGLRGQGRRLLEVGLFADRRLSIRRATAAFMEMMRFVFYRSCYDLADIMIGVHPRHAAFYQRNFGFSVEGPVDVHPVVNNRPVILLRGDSQAQLRANPVPCQVVDYIQRPLPRSTFNERAPLRPENLKGSVIAGFIERVDDSWSHHTSQPLTKARIA